MEGRKAIKSIGHESLALAQEIEKHVLGLTLSLKKKDLEIKLLEEKLKLFDDQPSASADRMCQQLMFNLTTMNNKLDVVSRPTRRSPASAQSTSVAAAPRRARCKSAPVVAWR